MKIHRKIAAPDLALVVVFPLTALLSAFLLFWVEPLFAKMVLPLLGGSPAVWNTCLMFFQAMLLLGYLYAHLSSRLLDSRRQAWVHVALLAVALLALPVAIPSGWTPPASDNVIGWLVALLMVGVGAPFLVLSGTAPLLQRWLSTISDPLAENPYRLYAASNAGSLIGLLMFPILMEPHLRLGQQSRLWSAGFVVALALTAGCAWIVWQRSQLVVRYVDAVEGDSDNDRAPSARDRLKWVALAFAPSSLLLGVTTYLSTDVAAVPLLWVVPLALYLITFIVVFARRSRETNRPIAIAHAVLVVALMLVLFWNVDIDNRWEYTVHLALFTATALVLHGELAGSRPSPTHLTEFYLWLAVGGALGGVFNAILAPLIFKTIAEYQLVVVVACFLRPTWRRTVAPIAGSIPRVAVALLPALMLGVVVWIASGGHHSPGTPVKVIASVVAAAIALSLSGNALRFGVSIAAMAILTQVRTERGERIIYADRSFFGAYSVLRAAGPANYLVHGTTIHGAQFLDSARRLEPVTYYHPRGPVGQLFAMLPNRPPGFRVGVVGLARGVFCATRSRVKTGRFSR
jgi:hypothetical protein